VIGNGVVLDPWALKAEVEKLTAQGVSITRETLQIADTCPLILPFHRDLDALREDASGGRQDRTTRRGIGPAYEDKVGKARDPGVATLPISTRWEAADRPGLLAHHDALRAGLWRAPRSTRRRD
jgi:adenylosuccinate synthase